MIYPCKEFISQNDHPCSWCWSTFQFLWNRYNVALFYERSKGPLCVNQRANIELAGVGIGCSRHFKLLWDFNPQWAWVRVRRSAPLNQKVSSVQEVTGSQFQPSYRECLKTVIMIKSFHLNYRHFFFYTIIMKYLSRLINIGTHHQSLHKSSWASKQFVTYRERSTKATGYIYTIRANSCTAGAATN